MEIAFSETFHKFSKAEKGVSSQWYDIYSLHRNLEHWEKRYYLEDTFEYLLQSEEYLVSVEMLNTYNNIIISSLLQALNETSAHEQI